MENSRKGHLAPEWLRSDERVEDDVARNDPLVVTGQHRAFGLVLACMNGQSSSVTSHIRALPSL